MYLRAFASCTAALLSTACMVSSGQHNLTSCEPDACGPHPEFSPRRCADGSLVGPRASCERREDESCGWSFEPARCPEDEACAADECGPLPDASPRRCADGSLVGPIATCERQRDATCDWDLEPARCPEDAECHPSDCGPPPLLVPRQCPDGSLIGPPVECRASATGTCEWVIGTAECPATGCAPDACGVPPELSPRLCADGSLVGPPVDCEVQASGTCGWTIGEAVCPEE